MKTLEGTMTERPIKELRELLNGTDADAATLTREEWIRLYHDFPRGLCAIISMSGTNGEPLACAYEKGHEGAHSWATLPTFVNGVSVREAELAAQIQRLTDQHGTFPDLGHKSELKGL
jgi:hypothetical protein